MIKTTRPKKIIIGLTVAIALLLFLHWLGGLRPLENLIAGLFQPTAVNLYTTGANLGLTAEEKMSKPELLKLLTNKDQQISGLISATAELKTLATENQTLRQQLNFWQTSSFKPVLANIVSRQWLNGQTAQNSQIIIDRGAHDGLAIGMAVLAADGKVVGKVLRLRDHSADICLLTSDDCSLAITVFGVDQTIGLATGALGLTAQINFIPQDKKIQAGDLVITSGLEELIPRGLAVGTVNQVSKNNNELWQTATIDPLVNLDDLTIVSVLKKL